MYNAPYQGVANNLAQYGRFGDSQLVHMNPIEVQMLSRLSPTGQLTRNPVTGQPEAFLPFLAPLLGSFLGSSLLTGAGAGLLGAAGLSSAAAGAIGSGLATTLATGDLEQGILSGLTGFGIGSALGGLGAAVPDVATTAATEAATQAGTQAATAAVPEAFVNASTIPSADAFLAEAAGTAGTPIDALNFNVADLNVQPFSAVDAGIPAFGPSVSPSVLESFSKAATLPDSVPLTMSERFAAPFRQPGQFISNLAKPESFLPVYVGETGRMARQQELAGQGSARAYEEEQEAEKARIRGQMADVFDQVRSAYPGVGYAAGGMVERYAEGGFNIDQDLINSLRFSNLPASESVQLSLRGSEFVPPPASSYSALDVGGEGYLAGVAPEFQYFRAPPPPPAVTPPGGPDFNNMPIREPGYDGFLDEYLSNYGGNFMGGRGVPGRGGMADDVPDFTGRPGRIDMGMPVYMGGSPNFDQSNFDSSIMEELLSEQFNPTRDRFSAIEAQPSVPNFNYSRIPASTPIDFYNLEMQTDSLNPFDDLNIAERRAEGGMTGMDNQSQMGAENSIVEMTVAAIRGEIENADQIISRFVEMYGPEVFTQLRERVLQDIVPGAQTNGMIEGEGGGQDDLVEGMIGTQRPVAVSPGEYIIPADVVSLAGGGYSGDGASFFDSLVDDIRQKTMGTTKQVRPYQRSV